MNGTLILLSYETLTGQYMIPGGGMEDGEDEASCCVRKLTERERSVGMEPRWVPVGQAIEIFSRHEDYAASDEMRRGIYLREYNALVNIMQK